MEVEGKVRENLPGRRNSSRKGWDLRKNDAFGNDVVSKVSIMSVLHILLANVLDNNICFKTGLC